MTRIKPWLPGATSPFVASAAIELTAAEVREIEGLLGASVDELRPQALRDLADELGFDDDFTARAVLEDVGGRYVEGRRSELTPVSAVDWKARVETLDAATRDLEAALRPFLDATWAAERMRRLIDVQLRRERPRAIAEARGPDGGIAPAPLALAYLAADVDLVLRSLAAARTQLDDASSGLVQTRQSTFWRDWLVDTLARFAAAFDVAATARNDEGPTTAFVQLIGVFQKALPEDCKITTWSPDALSQQTLLALRRSRAGNKKGADRRLSNP